MKNSSIDYKEIVEKIIDDPSSYDGWSSMVHEREANEIKTLINEIAWSDNDE